MLHLCRYSSAEHFAAKYTFYSSITTVVFILMTLQLLHVLHFQPKLSLITRTMGAAWDDLAHLFMLFFLVELSFALLGHVIYGSTVEELSTLGSSVVTLLLALFGEWVVLIHEVSPSVSFFAFFHEKLNICGIHTCNGRRFRHWPGAWRAVWVPGISFLLLVYGSVANWHTCGFFSKN